MPFFPFDYEVPARLIAQEPCQQRDRARLLTVHRREKTLAHHQFRDLPDLLSPGDLLILNDSRVLPARLLGRRHQTGGAWEGLFLRDLPDGSWEMLCQTRGRLEVGEMIDVDAPIAFAPSSPSSPSSPGEILQLRLVKKLPQGHWQVQPLMAGTFQMLLEKFGRVPLPPYIRKGREGEGDRERYQTVYGQKLGAVAAPTAGLHFTSELFERLGERGIGWAFVTLHVGLGTFQPIQVDDFTQHAMHREWGELSADTCQKVMDCRARGGKIVAVGTTSVRVLETVAGSGPLRPWAGETNLFIYPPYSFKIVDALITNFHLPRTTLLLLVCAFAGVEWTQTAYRTAIAENYRFYSYGDAMLVL